MINGHGDDSYHYGRSIITNFSSNVYHHTDLSGLTRHLSQQLDRMSSYPHPEAGSLQRAIADREQISHESVCVTNGATEAIYLVAKTFERCRSVILTPTFSEYHDACALHHHQLRTINSLKQLPDDADLLWLCNPNNPTGKSYEKGELLDAIAQHPSTLFVIDHAYAFFTKQPLITIAEAVALPNVVLLYSMTKQHAIPGLRLGYLITQPERMATIRAQRMPWSVNALAIAAGHYLLEQPPAINLHDYLQEKARFARRLSDLDGVTCLPSDTHFMLLLLHQGSAATLKEELVNSHGILIRDASNFEGLDHSYFRVATQRREENDLLVVALDCWIKREKGIKG